MGRQGASDGRWERSACGTGQPSGFTGRAAEAPEPAPPPVLAAPEPELQGGTCGARGALPLAPWEELAAASGAIPKAASGAARSAARGSKPDSANRPLGRGDAVGVAAKSGSSAGAEGGGVPLAGAAMGARVGA